MAEKYKKDGLVVLAVNAWDEDKGILEQYVEQAKLSQRVLLGGSQVLERYAVPEQRVPAVFWIDRSGVVKSVDLGPIGFEEMERQARELLAAKG